jgi:zinc protease
MDRTRIRRFVAIVAALIPAIAAAGQAPPVPAAKAPAAIPRVDIPYQKFVLPNGLRLIVHEDRKAPVVAVNVWYHVGSKNEPKGKSGFAHLFEHLMFNGSENFNKDYFQALERLGATDLNGTTSEDRTNYFQNVPTSALDTVLWLESDRMGHLLGAIDQAKLDEQRGVVQNEKRQFENQPYAVAYELTTRATYPSDHPYGHSSIGSMEDLNAASLEDVKAWFAKYYGPANAVIVIAGDIDAATAKAKVEKYFGAFPSGPTVARFKSWPAKRTGRQREVAQDRVPQTKVHMVWNIPGAGTADGDYLKLVSDILVSDIDKGSRLYKRLVFDEQIATEVSAYVDEREIGSLFHIEATVQPGGDVAKVEKAIEEELARLLKNGPASEEVARARTVRLASFVRGAERIGGFGGKSDILARSEVFLGSPDGWKAPYARIAAATPKDLSAAANRWLSDGVYVLEIQPFPAYTNASADADRKAMPGAGAPPAARFPAVARATLANGLELAVVSRPELPMVRMQLLVDAGYAADQGVKAGTARLTLEMLEEGTKTRGSLALSRELADLGATLATSSNLDQSLVTMSTLTTTLDSSLALFADVVRNPAFSAADLERVRKQQLAGIAQEKADPIGAALRLLNPLLYGPGHAYAVPFSGTGTEASVAAITREDLVRFHRSYFHPDNAALVVVGATTMAEIRPKLDALFASWPRGEAPKKNIAAVAPPEKPRVYLVDKKDAEQSIILAAVVGPSTNNPNEAAIETMNTALGGAFTSRLNMNLREDKHWSYGAGSFLPDARGPRPFIAYAPVQTDKTKESIAEVKKELMEIQGSRPLTADELDMAQSGLTLSLPGLWETAAGVGGEIGAILRFGRPWDYPVKHADEIRAVTAEKAAAAAKEVVRPDRLTWLIVGDRAKIEAGIRESGIGEVVHLDGDGNPVK